MELTTDIITFEGKTDFDISIEKWRETKPHGISGLFRLRNEAQFMMRAVMSHLPYLDEAVLIVQPSDDDTMAIAHDLAAKSNKVRVLWYPFKVHPIASDGHFNVPENSVHTMMHMTNWGISQCKFSWVAKIEGDVICLPTFVHIRKAVDKEPNAHRYYGRVGLNLAGEHGEKFSSTNPRNAGWDEAVFNNHPMFYCHRADKWETINLHDHPDKLVNFGWSFLHVKRCKRGAKQGIETWMPLLEGHVQMALRQYNYEKKYPGRDDPLGIPELYLDWQNGRIQ